MKCKDCESRIIGYCVVCTKFACSKCDVLSTRAKPTCSGCKKQAVLFGLKNMSKHFFNMWLDIKNKRLRPEVNSAYNHNCDYCKGNCDPNLLQKDLCTKCCTTHVRDKKCLHCKD